MTTPKSTNPRSLGLLEATSLSAAELADRMGMAMNRGRWKTLCPTVTIREDGPSSRRQASDEPGLTSAARGKLARQLKAQGYFHAPALLSPAVIENLREAGMRLKAAGWPLIFLAAFDEFWSLWQHDGLQDLLRECLGPGYSMRPRIWCYYVHPIRGARGWPPHADEFGAAGMSLWIPLNGATVENGCMYVIPKDVVRSEIELRQIFESSEIPVAVATELLHCARAVPAAPGSVLGWTFDTLHWGGVAQDDMEPRISVSAEFLPGDGAGDVGLPPWRPTDGIPSFDDRLRIVAENLQRFAPNDAWTFRYAQLGAALAEALTR